jgi:hypothetical protein
MTPTATPTSDIQPATEIPAALWHMYRQRRLAHNDKPRVATREALDHVGGYTSQRNREALADLLIARENALGLSVTPEEEEQELALAAAAAEAAEAAAVAQEVKRQVPELEEEWRRHQPSAAIGDRDAIEALAEIESELRTAKEEQDRQVAEAEAGEQAQREARDSAAASAEKMLPQLAARKAKIDKALAAVAVEVAGLRGATEQRVAFVAAATQGDAMAAHSARFRPDDVESAIRFHLAAAGLFAGVSGKDYPLVRENQGE